MSQSTETTRPDPLLDAYRQASAHEGARAGAHVRAAVLAHARVVAQSSSAAASATGVSDATRATPAANESRPIWRLAAGVVIGLVGVWIFQLTRPSAAPDTTVAALNTPTASSAQQADTAGAAAPTKTVTPASPEPAKPEAAVAVAALPVAKERAAQRPDAAREPQPDGARAEQNLAMAKAVAPKENADQPAGLAGASVAAAPAVAAPSVAAASAADDSVAAMSNEVVIASADTRKSARLQSRAELLPPLPALATAAPPPPAAPNAFPAQASGVAIAAAPTAGTTRSSPAIAAAPGDAASLVRLSEAEQQMFKAVRAGDAAALRIVITRGVNVNAKDERGRSALLIARERGDAETIKVLEAAGAR